MKTIISTLIILFLIDYSFGQSPAVFSVSVPNGAQPVQNSSVNSLEATKFKTQSLNAAENWRHYYLVGNVIIGYWEMKGQIPLRSLDKRVSELKGLHSLSPQNSYQLSIKDYNGIKYILEEYQLENTNYIRFYSDYVNGMIISGVIKFNAIDSKTAKSVLNTFLGSVKALGN